MRTNKQILFATAVLMTAVMGGEHTAVAANTDNTTVTITGTVRANTCTVSNSGGALGEVSVRDFTGTGNTAGSEAAVDVSFSGCGGNTKGVTVKVTGTPATATSSAFKNENDGQEGGATGVGVYFYDTNGNKISAGNDVSAVKQEFQSDTTLHYKAKFVGVSNIVGAGSLLTTITMSFTYT